MMDQKNGLPNKTNKESSEECVKVIIRCRPLSGKEQKSGSEKIVKVHSEKGIIEVLNPKSSHVKQFTFDTVYDDSAKQMDLYDETFRPLLDSVLMGFNGTVFAYGQTGAGKTYTMEGDPSNYEQKGIIPNTFDHIFNHIKDSQKQEYLVTASYLEIYQEEIRDLLSETVHTCELRQRPGSGVYVKDITIHVCKCQKELEDVLEAGKKNRSIGATNMNMHSSRSHAIFMLTIEQCELEGQNRMKIGKLNLVDLAGSERQCKTGTTGQRQKESIKINLSLSALGNVISALADGTSSHIPYRDSKLTRLLQDSLGGNSKTIMIANIGPADHNYEETLTTLRYANRAKNIKNTPIVNEDPKDALLKKYKEEIEHLKTELEKAVKEKRKKKRKKFKESSTGDFSDDIEADDEEILRHKEQLLKDEKAAILNDENIIAEEKAKLLVEIKARQEQLAKENEAKQALMDKIQALEGKLLSGGKNIIDHTNEQQKQLEHRRKELAEQKCREREILRKLEEEEETTLEMKETFTSLRQEVEVKTKKLKKLFVRLQALKRESHEEQEINSRERQEKEKIQDNLMRQLKYTHLVIENFVPPEEKAKILKRVQFDEDENTWGYSPIDSNFQPSPRPISANEKCKRPVCESAKKMWKLTSNPRYANENIAVIDLDYAAQSVSDYEPPDIDPVHRAVMDCAFAKEKDIEIDASDAKYNLRKKSARRRTRSKTARQKQKEEKDDYPTPRGLVNRQLKQLTHVQNHEL